MNEQISWHVELIIAPGRFEDFRTLTGEMVSSALAEPRSLCFERYFNDDEGIVHVYERYADSDAAVAHLRTFREEFSGRFEGMVQRKSFHVHGSPSDELKKLLDPLGAKYYEFLDGFSR